MRRGAVLYINGIRHEITDDLGGLMLGDYLRYERGLTGTKIVCAEGDCGACTVLRWHPYPEKKSKNFQFESINSCITLVAQMDGSSLVTVEGLKTEGELSPVQEAMMKCHGSQCGFCTPGFVMALTGLVEKKKLSAGSAITRKEAQNALTGNLCRCTGYEPILNAAQSIELGECHSLVGRYLTPMIQKDLRKTVRESLRLQGAEFEFFAPTRLGEVASYLAKNKNARILGASTDLGVLVNKQKLDIDSAVSLHLLPELYEISAKRGRMRVGARATLTELRRAAEPFIPELSRFVDIFASPQIKNAATLVGNLVNGSPIADTIPFLLAANAVVTAVGSKGKRTIPLDKFYLGYRKTALRPGELVTEVEFEIPAPEERLFLRKVSQRKDLDIACVSVAFRFAPGQVRIALGGVADVPVRLKKVESLLEKGKMTPQTVEQALALLQKEIDPISDLRGSHQYRRALVQNLAQRIFAGVTV